MNWGELNIKIPYGRTSGKIKTFCPACHSKRSNKSDKSLSVNLDEGLYKCHYCGFSGCIKEFPKKIKKEYVRPVWKNETKLSEKVVRYFEGRKISQDILRIMKISEGMEFMPQDNCKMNTIQFNYFLDGQLVNVKYRTGNKHFKLIPNAELIPYNLDAIKNSTECIITEGECFPGDAEILTEEGFVRFDEYSGENVGQVDKSHILSFVNPEAFIVKPYEGDLIEFKSRFIYSLTTPGHNLVFETEKRGMFKSTAEDLYKKKCVNWGIPVSLYGSENEGLNISDDMIKFYVAVSADFSIRDSGDIYGAFKKQRKVARFLEICNNLKIKVSFNIDGRGLYSLFIKKADVPKGCFKLFPLWWIKRIDYRQCKLLIEELRFWDGNEVNGRNQIEYSSKEYHNASFVQTIAHMAGYSSTIMKRDNYLGIWYKVSILFGKQFRNTQNIQKRRIPYRGKVYCVSVPTGIIVIRQNNKITITGNCDCLSFISCGFPHTISVPNGASANTSYLDDYWDEYFENKETVYIASDTDAKGIILRDELVRRFGAERCKIISYGEDCKDANELLVKKGAYALKQAVENSSELKIDGVFTVFDFEDELDNLYEKGLQKGLTIGFDNFDALCSFETKRMCIVTGIPGNGKSEFLDEIAERLNLLYGWKFAYFSPENFPLKYHASKMICKITGKKFDTSSLPLNEYRQAKQYMSDNFFFIFPEEGFSVDTILEKAKYLIRRKGIKALVIDPWNRLEHQIPIGMNETNYISQTLDKFTNFAQKYDILLFLVAHPRKMNKDSTGQFEVPTLYDINGSANFYNKTDYGITVQRNKEAGTVGVYVQKVKFKHLGETGSAVFKYNINNGRYVPCYETQEPIWDNSNHLIKKIADRTEEYERNTLPFEMYNGETPPF